MHINLCFKTYNCKLNLAACKSFHQQTGKDLNYLLMCYLELFRKNEKLSLVERLKSAFGMESTDVAAKLFHCLIVQEDKSIPLAEIEDAMFRVSWMPTDNDTDMCEPWPMVMLQLAIDVSSYYAELDKKKVIT
ncbi:MAG TPA: hypothetical protein EYN67_02855 [Flavobacteriales bacterium]|nr:hypothetical protein [Methylococcaceae bacterium]HHZ94504.1 hypothetical protein [Flavobacteriales bacterium]